MMQALGRAFGNRVTRHPALVMVLMLVLCAISAVGLSRMSIQTDVRMFFSDRNPDLAAFQAFEEQYGREDLIVFVLKKTEGSVLDPAFLEHLDELTKASADLPGVTRVESLTAAFETLPPIGDPVDLKARFAAAPLIEGRLISEDGTTTAIFAHVILDQDDPFEVQGIASEARALIERFHADYPRYEYGLTGSVMLNAAIMDVSLRDGVLLFPLLGLIVLILLYVFFRAVLPVGIVLVTITAASVAAMGLGGWAGLSLNVASAVAPTITLTLAIADCIHLLVGAARQEAAGMARREAMALSIERNFRPIVITSLTTAVGFLALNFSDAPPIQTLGSLTAIGVMVALVLGLTVVPALAVLWPDIALRGRGVDFEGWRKWRGGALVRVLMRGAAVVIILTVLLAAAALYQASRMPINDELVDYFEPSVSFRQDTDFAQTHLIGLNVMEFTLKAPKPDGLYDPTYLERVEAFSSWLAEQPDVVGVVSLPGLYRQMGVLIGTGDRLPATADEARAKMALAGSPDGPALTSLIDLQDMESRVSANVQTVPTYRLLDLKEKAEEWLDENFPQNAQAQGTGWSVMFAQLTVRNVQGMILGTAATLLIVSTLMALFFASPGLALLALGVNLVPLVMTYGLWGLARGQFSLAATVAAAVAVGILVDFSIHLLSRFRLGRKERGLSREDAVAYAYSEVGTPIVIISLTLVAGFAVLLFSQFGFNKSLGLMTALSVSLAFVTNLIVLPALLRAFTPK